MERLFAELAAENHLIDTGNVGIFAERAAHYIAELNAIHPFREGNGPLTRAIVGMAER